MMIRKVSITLKSNCFNHGVIKQLCFLLILRETWSFYFYDELKRHRVFEKIFMESCFVADYIPHVLRTL